MPSYRPAASRDYRHSRSDSTLSHSLSLPRKIEVAEAQKQYREQCTVEAQTRARERAYGSGAVVMLYFQRLFVFPNVFLACRASTVSSAGATRVLISMHGMHAKQAATANPRTTNLDFRGFGSSRFLIIRGETPRSIGDFQET